MWETVIISAYSNRCQAEVAQSVLQTVGIESIIIADDCFGLLALICGAKLRVLKRDEERARKTLRMERLRQSAG